MYTEFQSHINTHFPEIENQSIGLAISGGVDSVVAAHLLKKIGYSITFLHCNFMLRGDASNGDQAFVKRLSEQLNTVLVTTEFNTSDHAEIHKTSIQIAARELRYEWFLKMAKLHQLKAVVTAHHSDDNLETFLINLSRGTGLEGLTGIPPKNGLFIRPLLAFSKGQILDYAKKNNIEWRNDTSNNETKYLRNKIRHNIVPELKSIQPQFLTNFVTTITHLQQSRNFINTEIDKKTKHLFITDHTTNGYKIKIESLLQLPHLELFLFESLKKYNFTAWMDIKNLLYAQPSSKIISSTHILLKDREYLLLYPIHSKNASLTFTINKEQTSLLIPDGQFILERNNSIQNTLSTTSIYIDTKKITYPLIVRKWQEGDYFYPLGMQGRKKISKYFKDEKYSLPKKEQTWLLCSQNEIIWIVGKRADRRFAASNNIKNSVKITYESNL